MRSGPNHSEVYQKEMFFFLYEPVPICEESHFTEGETQDFSVAPYYIFRHDWGWLLLLHYYVTGKDQMFHVSRYFYP